MTDYRRPHVLIVSDDLDLSQFLQSGLTIAGFWTSTVASALQTLEVFRLRTFDLMLVDALLEGLGAGELLQRLRAPVERDGPPRTDIPILLIAASEDEISVARAKELGANGAVYAPIEIEDLALDLFGRIREWRELHPDRLWADELAQRKA
jgi:DNA-binding response OmpR family regulator